MRTSLLIISLCLSPAILCAQPSRKDNIDRKHIFSISTNALNWLALGTVNMEASVAPGRHLTIGMAGRYNPWTFAEGDRQRQIQLRERTVRLGCRYWPWFVYSGWWVDAAAQMQEYNRIGIVSRNTEEGDAYGLSLGFGYTLLLTKSLNLEFGAWLWGGWKRYTRYACPSCGREVDGGRKLFWAPDNLALSLVYVF